MRFPKLNAARMIHSTLMWSKAFVPVMALFAGIASAIRTVQTVTELYTASGSAPIAVILAAVMITFAADGAVFVLGLAQESQRIRWRSARRKRYVTSIRSVGRMVSVRLGRVEPLSHDQMPESDTGLNTLIWIAFAFSIASNLYQGLKPLTEQAGNASIQSFVGFLVNAPARVQLMFIVDFAGVLFPPFMALKAGHLTARFASEVTGAAARSESKTEHTTARTVERATSVQKGSTERVIEHLNDHPEDRALSQRSLAAMLNVSVGTVNTAKQSFSANGHERK